MKIDKRFGKNRKILTPEQEETLKKSYKSRTNAQLANELGVSIKTVSSTLTRLGLNRAEEFLELEGEQWKISTISPDYAISNFGRVFSLATERLIRQEPNSCGYMRFGWQETPKKRSKVLTHREVALLFLSDESADGKQVNHKDGNKQNNHAANLEWVTGSENTAHAYANGLVPSKKGIRRGSGIKHSVETIRNVKWLIADGKTNSEVATSLKMDRSYVSEIRRGEKQRNVRV